jgi:TATA-box binding protein (TBP) (component of TFIID and TFIIIB)
MDLNEEWSNFLSDEVAYMQHVTVNPYTGVEPSPSPLYISTHTIISYLNQSIQLAEVFWNLPIIPYHVEQEGIIKKQMKINSTTKYEVADIEDKIKKYPYGYRMTIKHIDNEKGNIKYKDVCKVTIGISKKDIMSYRIKQKGAFYNCFVLILRVFIEQYKEFHVKIFNTGKIEIPGIQNRDHIPYIIKVLLEQLRPYYPEISYNEESEEVVLINSNFNCGYYINRDNLYHKLRYDKNVSAVYDPCSYPGIQCKIYYTDEGEIVTTPVEGNSVSFMIFRTGSILIVGKCSQSTIYNIYNYIIAMLKDLFMFVVDNKCVRAKPELLKKKVKKFILIK